MSGPNDGYLVGPAGRTTFTVGFHVIKESCEAGAYTRPLFSST